MTQPTDSLFDELRALGCGVETTDGHTYVTLPDEYAEFVFDRSSGHIYLGTTFLTPEELDESEHRAALDRFLLELHDRSLGCHFSYDRSGHLTIGAELCAGQEAPQQVLQAMEQIAYVIESCIPMCDQVLDSGEIPEDSEVDEAFGLRERLH